MTNSKKRKAENDIIKKSKKKIGNPTSAEKDHNTDTHTKDETDTPQFTRRDRSGDYRAATK